MLPRYSETKGMFIKGHYWLIHPQTGEKWTRETAAAFIDSYEVKKPVFEPDNKLVAGVKKLVGAIKWSKS